MIKRQFRWIVIGLAAVAALLCVYLFVISPMLGDTGGSDPLVLEEGEAAYGANNYLMYRQYKDNEIQSVKVRNGFGEYEIYASVGSEGREFVIRGKETASLDQTKLSGLLSAVDFTLVSKKLTDVDDYKRYGIDPDSPEQSYYILKTVSGDEYKVLIGDIIPSDTAYYCKLEGRDSVYLLDTSVDSLTYDIKYFVSPYLAFPTVQEDYYAVDDFELKRDGQTVVKIDYLNENEREANGKSEFYRMTYPTAYNVAFSNYESILKLFSSYLGDEIMEFDHINSPLTREVLAKYGLDEPKYSLHFKYRNYVTDIYYSDVREDGRTYAYSALFNQICAIDSSKAGFLEWKLLKFVDPALFAVNIYDIAQIRTQCGDIDETFLLSGDSSENFAVRMQNSGKAVETSYFREYYMNILTLYLRDYTESRAEDRECALTVTVTTKKGVTTVYGFYPYSTGHCYYTVDGEGEFYLLRDEVDKLIKNTERLIAGEPVDNSYKN